MIWIRTFNVAADFVWSDEWSVYGQHRYKYFDDGSITGERAASECQKMGALLASINDPQEADFISNRVLRKRTLSAFIGATDTETGTLINNSLLHFQPISGQVYRPFKSRIWARVPQRHQ